MTADLIPPCFGSNGIFVHNLYSVSPAPDVSVRAYPVIKDKVI